MTTQHKEWLAAVGFLALAAVCFVAMLWGR